jgi:hypothetical protein
MLTLHRRCPFMYGGLQYGEYFFKALATRSLGRLYPVRVPTCIVSN